MDKQKRKELVEMYKNRKPEMGIISYKCKETGDVFLGISRDANADFNSTSFKLSAKMHPNKRLQELWNKYGSEGFETSVAMILEYDNPDEDYTEDLELLLDECMSKEPKAVKL